MAMSERVQMPLTGLQKAAALLATLGQDTSADIVRHLKEPEVERITQAIAQMRQLTSERAEEVLEEFHQMIVAQKFVITGGFDYAKNMLHSAFGTEAAVRLLDRVKVFMDTEAGSFDTLKRADPQQLATFVVSEHPQTIALVLCHLGPSQAGALLATLPAELQTDVAIRMANLDQISPEVINKITGVIEQKLKSVGEVSRESFGGVKAVAEMINQLDLSASKSLLGALEKEDLKLHETIRHLMFVFEDLSQLDVNELRELISKADRKALTIAMKGTSEQLKAKILSVMSQRSADMLREDMDVLGAVRIREVEAAQQQIISQVREMEKEGKISLQQSEYVE